MCTSTHAYPSAAFRRLQRDLAEGALASGDSFYIRVNLNVSSQSDSCSLSVHCDEIVHVLDTRYQNRCEWLCTRVDPYSGADLNRPMDRGTIPSNSRYERRLAGRVAFELYRPCATPTRSRARARFHT